METWNRPASCQSWSKLTLSSLVRTGMCYAQVAGLSLSYQACPCGWPLFVCLSVSSVSSSLTFSFLSLLTGLREWRLLVATVTSGTTEGAEGRSWSLPPFLGQASRRSTAQVKRLASPEGFPARKRLGHTNRLPRNLKGGGRWPGVRHSSGLRHSRALGPGWRGADLRDAEQTQHSGGRVRRDSG